MKDKINLGIIGCGYWGPNFVRNFTQMPEVRLKAICDLSPDRLKQIKGIYAGLETYSDYKRLLKDEAIDAVVVSTPALTHYEIARAALNRNKHVLLEKPISTKISQAKRLVELAHRRRRILMVGHTFMYNPAVNKIRAMMQVKELGKIYYIHSRRTNLGPIRKDVDAIWDLAPHDISITNYLLNSFPEEVSAYGQRFLAHIFNDVGFITLKYPGDILVHIHVSWLDPKKNREITVIGSRKMLVYDDINAFEPIRIYDKNVMQQRYDKTYRTFNEFQSIIRDGEVIIPRINMQEPLKIECQAFIESIVKNSKPASDGNEGLKVLRILDAINRSVSGKGKRVRL